jgi:hypothetical protein
MTLCTAQTAFVFELFAKFLVAEQLLALWLGTHRGHTAACMHNYVVVRVVAVVVERSGEM